MGFVQAGTLTVAGPVTSFTIALPAPAKAGSTIVIVFRADATGPQAVDITDTQALFTGGGGILQTIDPMTWAAAGPAVAGAESITVSQINPPTVWTSIAAVILEYEPALAQAIIDDGGVFGLSNGVPPDSLSPPAGPLTISLQCGNAFWNPLTPYSNVVPAEFDTIYDTQDPPHLQNVVIPGTSGTTEPIWGGVTTPDAPPLLWNDEGAQVATTMVPLMAIGANNFSEYPAAAPEAWVLRAQVSSPGFGALSVYDQPVMLVQSIVFATATKTVNNYLMNLGIFQIAGPPIGEGFRGTFVGFFGAGQMGGGTTGRAAGRLPDK